MGHCATCTCRPDPAPTRAPTDLERAIGQGLVQLSREVTVYVFGGDEGRRQVDALWAQRETQARQARSG